MTTLPPEVAESATTIRLVGPCVYFLLDGEEVVYVGSSRNGVRRIIYHIGRFEFDSAAVLPVHENERVAKEYYYIRHMQPKHNTSGTKREPRGRAKWLIVHTDSVLRDWISQAARSEGRTIRGLIERMIRFYRDHASVEMLGPVVKPKRR